MHSRIQGNDLISSNQEVISAYLTWCENEKRFSGETIATYFSALNTLRKYLDERKLSVLSLSTDVMREYFVSLNSRKNLSKISVNDYRAALRTFFKYLLNKNLIDSDPMKKVGRQKEPEPIHDALTMQQLKRIIEQVDEAGTFLFRDTVMFELFWNSGLRTTELSNLEERHLKMIKVREDLKDKKGNKIGEKIHNVFEINIEQGKGGKERIVTVTETTTMLLKQFLHAKKLLYPVTEFVFPSRRGEKLHRRQIYEIISNFLDLSTTKKKGAHVLRHTYATMLINKGVSIMTVKELLGHSNVSTTTIYTKPSQEMLADTFNRAHPKGDKKKIKKENGKIGIIKNYKFDA